MSGVDGLKALLAKKKQEKQELVGDKKYMRKQELEEARLKRLREEEEQERLAKACRVECAVTDCMLWHPCARLAGDRWLHSTGARPAHCKGRTCHLESHASKSKFSSTMKGVFQQHGFLTTVSSFQTQYAAPHSRLLCCCWLACPRLGSSALCLACSKWPFGRYVDYYCSCRPAFDSQLPLYPVANSSYSAHCCLGAPFATSRCPPGCVSPSLSCRSS